MIAMAQHSRHKLAALVLLLATAAFSAEKSVEALKAEAEKATGGHQARLYAELAQQLVETADQQFTDGQVDAAQASVQDVLKYAALARDISLRTRGKMKETEIHLRNAERRLDAVRRTLSVDDRPPLEDVVKKIEHFRQELLNAMFADPKKEKKP